ncbi:MAG: ribonuclease H-like domain-containing protein, partial [Armatimonadota bacterium]|nr:ribonuclease H-like domain-containing protein [Armatimonadota bacterium]
MDDSPPYIDSIEQMNRGPVRHLPKEVRGPTLSPHASPVGARLGLPARGWPALHAAVGGEEVVAPGGGRACQITRRLAGAEPYHRWLGELFRRAVEEPHSALHGCLRPRVGREPLRAEEVALVDLETCGLSGAHAAMFLIGVLTWEEDALVVRQFFARRLHEERAIATLFA